MSILQKLNNYLIKSDNFKSSYWMDKLDNKKYDFRKATADWYNHFTVHTYDVKLIWEKKERNKVRSEILRILNNNIQHFSI